MCRFACLDGGRRLLIHIVLLAPDCTLHILPTHALPRVGPKLCVGQKPLAGSSTQKIGGNSRSKAHLLMASSRGYGQEVQRDGQAWGSKRMWSSSQQSLSKGNGKIPTSGNAKGASWKGRGKGSKAKSTANWIEQSAPCPLRFEQGDRVVCNLGERWAVGTVLSTNVDDPEEPGADKIPYVVKVDAGTISAPVDEDQVIRRERCFDAGRERFVAECCASAVSPHMRKPLRFSAGDQVAIRVMDLPTGFENWRRGRVLSTWMELSIGPAEGKVVPYVIQTDRGTYYCHRDDHTLIRQPEHVPQTLQKSISKRFEQRKRPDGTLEVFDHATLRSKLVSNAETEILEN